MPASLKQVGKVQFELLTSKTLLSMSTVSVTSPVFYSQYPEQQVGGLLDLHLGMSSKNGVCASCGLDVDRCPGHFGHIQLELPVIHPGYIKQVQQILKNVCWNCSRYVGEDAKVCKYCQEKCQSSYTVDNDRVLLTPVTIKQIFERIPSTDLKYLKNIIRNNRPEALIIQTFPVPPSCIRPSVRSSMDPKKSNEDELSMSLSQILFLNLQLKDCLYMGKEKMLMIWLQLQNEVCKFIGVDQIK